MPDAIHACHRIIRLVYPQLVEFIPEYWGQQGIEPNRHRERQARWGRILGHRFFSRRYAGVPGRVHLHDNMLMSNSAEELAHYVKVGESALACMRRSLQAAGLGFGDMRAVLDFPSGYGRALRHLVRAVDPKYVTACELEEEGLMFCAQEFGVRAVRSSRNLDELKFPEAYDLIWVGSLFTHLPTAEGRKLLARLAQNLTPRGLLIFSTQGPSCLPQAENYGFMFKGRAGEFEAQYAAQGMAYLPYYADAPGYGIAFYAPDAVRAVVAEALPGCTVLQYAEQGLDQHQDVWTVQRQR
jgi:SAM-dependent methyltransferase